MLTKATICKPENINLMLAKYLEQKFDNENVYKTSHSLSNSQGIPYEEIVRKIEYVKDITWQQVEYALNKFLDTNPFTKNKKGIANIPKSKRRVSYTIEDGKVYFIEIEGFGMKNLYHKNEYVDTDVHKIIFAEIEDAILTRYPILSNRTTATLDMIEICNIANGKDSNKYEITVFDVIDYIKEAAKRKALIEIPSRINSGKIDYRITVDIKDVTKLFKVPVNVLNSKYDLHILPCGTTGFISNGFEIGYKDGHIYNVSSDKKVDRFIGDYRNKKKLDPTYNDEYTGTNEWTVTELEDYNYNSPEELEAKLISTTAKESKHTLLNINGGFYLTPAGSTLNSPYLYAPEAKFEDMFVDNLVYTFADGTTRQETPEEREKRISSNQSILDLFSKETYVIGLKTTNDSMKYTKSYLGIPFTKEDLMKMKVSDVCRMAKHLAMVRPYAQYESKNIGNDVNMFINYVLNPLSKFNPKQMENKDEFMKARFNSIKRKNRNNEDALETILNDEVIQGIEAEYYSLLEEYNSLIDRLQDFKYADKLDGENTIKLGTFERKYYKATGKTLQIQNFKKETVNLINQVLDENKEFIGTTKNKELKKEFKALNKSIRILKRALKKDLMREVIYKDIKIADRTLKCKTLAENVKSNIQQILGNAELLNTGYNTSNLIKLSEHCDRIISNAYAKNKTDTYSYNYHISNEFARIDWNRKHCYIM